MHCVYVFNDKIHLKIRGQLGPHDLCTVVKVGRKNSFIGRLSDVAGGGPTGAYHFVSGADVGSVAAVAAYFYDLIQRQETTTLWGGWYGTYYFIWYILYMERVSTC